MTRHGTAATRSASTPGMTRRRTTRALGIAAIGAAMLPAHAEDAPKAAADCRAELVCETTGLRPGTEAVLGVRFTLAEHWHVYWRNPGESGLAPSVEWTLPEGFSAGPIQWPAPRRVDSGGIVGYGYEGSVLLPVTLHVPATAKAADAVLAAHVKWLACNESCVPGEANVELKLPVKDARPVADPAMAQAFADARALLPRTPGAVALESTAERVTLTFRDAALSGEEVRAAEFFPAEQLVLDDAATAVLESADRGAVRVRLTPAPRRKEPVRQLAGVLVVRTAKRSIAFEIDVRTADAKEPRPNEENDPR